MMPCGNVLLDATEGYGFDVQATSRCRKRVLKRRGSQPLDLRKTYVGPARLEATTYGLEHCRSPVVDAGIDITTLALWLGHESTDSTELYLHADLGMKQRALDRLAPPQTRT
jgi:integrase